MENYKDISEMKFITSEKSIRLNSELEFMLSYFVMQ